MIKKQTKTFLALCVTGIAFSMPAVSETLYSWHGYQQKSYNYLKKNDETSYKNLIKCYENIISSQKSGRKTVPPGIYADYGWILIKNGNVEKGKEMLQKEMELYPESTAFITRILKRFEADETK